MASRRRIARVAGLTAGAAAAGAGAVIAAERLAAHRLRLYPDPAAGEPFGDLRDVLGVLGRVPVTVVTGERDRLVPPRLGAEAAAEIPGARLIMVAGAGHVLMLERPDVVNDAITSLLGVVQQDERPCEPRRSRGEGGVRGVA